jgi:hypothetical protein
MAGLSPFLQNYAQANLGTNQLANALGLNGPQGNAAAIAGFQNNPSYQFGLRQGEDAIAAQAARGGMGASGNALLAADQFGTNYANQNWNNYIGQLTPYLNYAAQGAGGALQGYGNLGQGLGNLYSNLGQNLNQNFMGLGGGLNQSFANQGNAAYGAQSSIGNAQANAELAQAGANANILNAIGGGAKAVAGMLSDKTMKEDMEPVGKLFDGQKVYRYREKGDPRHRIGLIAQEVERIKPDAVVQFTPHVKGVDYRTATNAAAEIAKFLGAP